MSELATSYEKASSQISKLSDEKEGIEKTKSRSKTKDKSVTPKAKDKEIDSISDNEDKSVYKENNELESRPRVVSDPPSVETSLTYLKPKAKYSAFDVSSKSEHRSDSSSSKNEKIEKRQEEKRLRSILRLFYDSESSNATKGYIKMRGAFNQWATRYAILSSATLVYFKNEDHVKKETALGIVYLRGCQANVRKSKKHGFCFMITNLLGKSMYSSRGLRGEVLPRGRVPMGGLHRCILRLESNTLGEKWLNAVREAIDMANNMTPSDAALLFQEHENVNGQPSLLYSKFPAATDEQKSEPNDQKRFTELTEAEVKEEIRKEEMEFINGDTSSEESENEEPAISPTPNFEQQASVDSLLVHSNSSQNIAANINPIPINNLYSSQSVLSQTGTIVSSKSPPLGYDPILRNRSLSEVSENEKEKENEKDIESVSLEKLKPQSEPDVAKSAIVFPHKTPPLPPKKKDNESEVRKESERIHKREISRQKRLKRKQTKDALSLTKYVPFIPKPDLVTDEDPANTKSLMSTITKQLGSGDGSLTLPIQFLEPKSFLEKTLEYFVHPVLLSDAVIETDPMQRFLGVLKWYLSNFYAMPTSLKKPYNPILGERFRTILVMNHKTKSKACFVSEQVSHHPPVSAFHCSSRKDGWIVSGSILTKSSFSGMSLSSIFDATCCVFFPAFQECYEFALPSVVAKGLLFPPITVEFYGSFDFKCAKTGIEANIEFKLKPKFGGDVNQVSVKVKSGKEIVYTISGRFDKTMTIKDLKTKEEKVFLEVKGNSLPFPKADRFDVTSESQTSLDSELMWYDMTSNLIKNDTDSAYAAKKVLEEKQREEARIRKESKIEWVPSLFVSFDKENEDTVQKVFEASASTELISKRLSEDNRKAVLDKKGNCWWKYIHHNAQAFNPETEIEEVESDFVIFSIKKDGIVEESKEMIQPSLIPKEPLPVLPEKVSEIVEPVVIKPKVSVASVRTDEQFERLIALSSHLDKTASLILEETRRMNGKMLRMFFGFSILFVLVSFFFRK